jgi:hypothetical protein
MQEADFRDGIRTIQVALQVEPDPKRQTSKDIESNFRQEFVDYLWKSVHRADADAWRRAVDRLSILRCKPVDLTLGHFLEALEAVLQEDELKRSLWQRQAAPASMDLKKIREKILRDPTVPELSKRYVAAMARNPNSEESLAPRPKGGEKYKRRIEKKS